MSSSPSRQRLRAAVIGCGAISHEHLPVLRSSDLVSLDAVCDTSAALADFARERYGARAAFTEVAEMLTSVRPDVVHVLTPPPTHVQLIEMCLEQGSHVICEKPMTGTADATHEILARAAEAGRDVVETRNLLYNDPVLALDRLVASGALGTVREVDVLLSLDLTAGSFGDVGLGTDGIGLPGGAVHDFLPHLCYLFLHFADHPGGVGDAERVEGRIGNLSGNPRVGLDWLDALISVGDVRGRLRIASDVGPDSFRLYVRGSKASAEVDLYQPYLRREGPPNVGKRAPLGLVTNGSRSVLAGFRNARDKVYQHGTYHGVERMLTAIYRSLRGEQPRPITAEQMIDVATLIDRLVALPMRSR